MQWGMVVAKQPRTRLNRVELSNTAKQSWSVKDLLMLMGPAAVLDDTLTANSHNRTWGLQRHYLITSSNSRSRIVLGQGRPIFTGFLLGRTTLGGDGGPTWAERRMASSRWRPPPVEPARLASPCSFRGTVSRSSVAIRHLVRRRAETFRSLPVPPVGASAFRLRPRTHPPTRPLHSNSSFPLPVLLGFSFCILEVSLGPGSPCTFSL